MYCASVGTVTILRPEDGGEVSHTPGQTPRHSQRSNGEINGAGRKTDRSLQPRAEVNIAWSLTSTSPYSFIIFTTITLFFAFLLFMLISQYFGKKNYLL
jgi:hypothetical protein